MQKGFNMANSETFKVEGLAECIAFMEDLGKEMTQARTARLWNRVTTYAMQPIKADAFKEAPHRTNQMRSRLYIAAHRPTARDKSARSFEVGTTYMGRVAVNSWRPKESKKKITSYTTKTGKLKLKAYTQFRGSNRPVVLAQEYGTPKSGKTKATHFLVNTLRKDYAIIPERLANAIFYEMKWGKFIKDNAPEMWTK